MIIKLEKGFTLAEVMITLTVIGIISAVILPVAFHSKPDEDVLKFKKAHNTLYKVINELINSDKYYLNGDLGRLPSGELVNDEKYFCKTFLDIITTTSSSCVSRGDYHNSYWAIEQPVTDLDLSCKLAEEDGLEEITTADKVLFYEGSTNIHFGKKGTPIGISADGLGFVMNDDDLLFYDNLDSGGFNRVYKIFCIDIDGSKKGVEPFGYGIRVDGKIMVGKNAQDWLEKSIQGEN